MKKYILLLLLALSTYVAEAQTQSRAATITMWSNQRVPGIAGVTKTWNSFWNTVTDGTPIVFPSTGTTTVAPTYSVIVHDGTGLKYVTHSNLFNIVGSWTPSITSNYQMLVNTNKYTFLAMSTGDVTETNFGTRTNTSTGLQTIASPSLTITSPTLRLSAAGTPGAGKVLQSDANGYATWETPTSGWALNGNTVTSEKWIGTVDNFALPFRTNNVENMILDASGNLGIGIDPTARLHAIGTQTVFSSYVAKFQNQDNSGYLTVDNTGATVVRRNSVGSNSDILTVEDNAGDDILRVQDAGVIYFGKTWYGTLVPITINQGWLQIGGATSNASFHIKSFSGYDMTRYSVGSTLTSKVSELGYFGINTGTVVPVSPLEVKGAGATSATNTALFENSAGTDLFVIRDDGNVGIGTNAPTAKIHLPAGGAAASNAPLKLTTGTSNTVAEAGAMEYTTPALFFTNGTAVRQELVLSQQSRVSTQYDATTTTLGNVTGLTANVASAGVYKFEAILNVTADAVGGHKYAISGTATATNIIYQINALNSNGAYAITSRETALGGSAEVVMGTTLYTTITGTITVNAAGTLTVQFSESVASGTSSVLVGSTFTVTQIQ